jgi:hypothetical protein
VKVLQGAYRKRISSTQGMIQLFDGLIGYNEVRGTISELQSTVQFSLAQSKEVTDKK